MFRGTRLTTARRLGRTSAIAIATATVVLCGHVASAGAARWLAPQNISTPQGGGTFGGCGFLTGQAKVAGVNVAVNASGETVVVWTRANGPAQEVQASIRPPGGTFGPPQTLGTTQPCYFLGILGPTPKAAIDPQGNAVVVWAHPLAATTVVQAASRPAGGSFGPPVDLSDQSRTTTGDPTVAISASGTAVAVWTWNNTSNKNVIQVSTKTLGGSFPPAGAATTISDAAQDATAPNVATNGRGDVAVVWQRFNGANQIAQARVRPAGGSFAAVVNLSDAGADAAGPPAIAIDPAGRATAVWTRSNLVESRFLTAAGAIDGGVDNVSDTAETVSFPTVALDASNNAVVVWSGGPDSLTKAAARASRASFGPPQTISGPSSQALLPAVAMDPAGNAVAMWSQSLSKVQAATRPPGGTFGGVDDVSVGGAAAIPSLAIDGEASAVVGWAFLDTNTNLMVPQVAIFDAGAPAITAASVAGTGTTGVPTGMSAAATDRWSGASISWDFGDGATGAGASVQHAYGAPGVYTVTITATDGAGNGVSTQRTIQIANPVVVANNPPLVESAPQRIVATLSFKYSASNSSTKITSFSVKGVPSGATVTVTCTPPKRKGKTRKCPAKSFKKTNARGTVKLTSFAGKRFKKGTVIEVRVTKPGTIGAVKRLTIKGRSGPTTATSCLLVGAKNPSRC